MAALILILRSDKAERSEREAFPSLPVSAPDADSMAEPGEAPHELLVAWVQFLKSDIMSVVNTLHNRLNVISQTVSELETGFLPPERRQAVERIRHEGERAIKITSGLLHRVNALAPETVPPVLFEYDDSGLPPGRILLIESDDANRTVIGKLFQRLGQEVTAVANGFEAFTVLESAQPDCIISDVRLPYLDGRTLFEQVEQQMPQLASRFVFVTGDYTNPATMKFLRTTGQPYVAKPYEVEALLGAVAAVLRSRLKDGSKAIV